MNKIVIIVVISVVILIGGSFLSQSLQKTDQTLISSSGIHWHPQLEIYANGEQIEIPANIGLFGNNASMHTHDNTGELHLETGGVVRENDVRLSRFFEIWGKEFNSGQLLGFENGNGSIIKMFVNGEENTEFENYIMRDGDRIEIRYQ